MYFEEFEIGKKTVTPAKQITAEALDTFLDISGLHLPLFMNDEAAQGIGHKKRLTPGPMILSLTMGLVKETGWFDHIVAVLEFEQLRFLKAMHIGDTIQAEMTVKFTKPTKNPNRGLVILSYLGFNQAGDNVLSADGKYLMQTRK
ncbi:MAG: MaoC/PaaZ C-terminal domain-containing protein [Pseudomonadota bacterium]